MAVFSLGSPRWAALGRGGAKGSTGGGGDPAGPELEFGMWAVGSVELAWAAGRMRAVGQGSQAGNPKLLGEKLFQTPVL